MTVGIGGRTCRHLSCRTLGSENPACLSDNYVMDHPDWANSPSIISGNVLVSASYLKGDGNKSFLPQYLNYYIWLSSYNYTSLLKGKLFNC